MSEISGTAWFKQTSLETSQWIWGTLSGAFNEKQTIGQIITDAAIGMIPLVGDVTAVRDLLAVSIGLINEPKKRESTTEWVFLVVLLFALIPVIGGVIKGVGRLVLKATADAAKNAETLKEVVQFLNRIGEGNAPKWLKALDVQSHQAVLLEKFGAFCNTMITVTNKILGSTIGRALPEKWHGQLYSLVDGFASLRDMGTRMIPQALRELDLKLKVIQGMVYKGKPFSLATSSGRATVRRESEAYMIERELREAAKQGTRYPSVQAETRFRGSLSRKYQKTDYPDILHWEGENPAFPGKTVFTDVASFSGEITAKSAREMGGKTLFRAFGNKSEFAKESYAAGGFWGYQKTPETAEEWREFYAVLDEWNGNGFLVVLHLPEDFGTRMPGANAWQGKIAEQFGVTRPDQYLKGGGEQVIIKLDERVKRMVNNYGNQAKANGQAMTVDIQGVNAEFYPSRWEDVSGKYGYSKPEGIEPPYASSTRQLHDDELRSKVTQRSIVNAARIEHQTSTEGNK
jgi:hypothetical protein